MLCLVVFLCLQVLDFITTIVGFSLGGYELSPFVRWLTALGPTTGVAIAKLGACLLAGVCLWLRKERVIYWANYFFAALVLWNLAQILRVLA